MIGLTKAKEKFKEYLKDYDSNDCKVKFKIEHTYSVIGYSEYITKVLRLNKEDVELAILIALLHDIARFNQVKKFNHFYDTKSYDHGNAGVEILFTSLYIRDFIKEDKYDNIISKAIKNHNKYAIEEGLTTNELLHAKIIRDADKLDNFRMKEIEDYEDIDNLSKEELEHGIISDEIYNDFLAHKLILASKIKTALDSWMCCIAYVFDLYFHCSYALMKEKDYINITFNRIDYKNEKTKKRIEKLRKCANDYIDSKLEEEL